VTPDELDAAVRAEVRNEAGDRAIGYAAQAVSRHAAGLTRPALLADQQAQFWSRLAAVIDGSLQPRPGDLEVIRILATEVRARLRAEARYEAQRARIHAAEGSTA
jgi:hypothetical protein